MKLKTLIKKLQKMDQEKQVEVGDAGGMSSGKLTGVSELGETIYLEYIESEDAK